MTHREAAKVAKAIGRSFYTSTNGAERVRSAAATFFTQWGNIENEKQEAKLLPVLLKQFAEALEE